jgi:hypothetical protein
MGEKTVSGTKATRYNKSNSTKTNYKDQIATQTARTQQQQKTQQQPQQKSNSITITDGNNQMDSISIRKAYTGL